MCRVYTIIGVLYFTFSPTSKCNNRQGLFPQLVMASGHKGKTTRPATTATNKLTTLFTFTSANFSQNIFPSLFDPFLASTCPTYLAQRIMPTNRLVLLLQRQIFLAELLLTLAPAVSQSLVTSSSSLVNASLHFTFLTLLALSIDSARSSLSLSLGRTA